MISPDASDTSPCAPADYSGCVPWSYLAPHAEKGTLYFVDPSIPLTDAGSIFSGNDAEVVALWLKSGDLVKIEALHAAQWQGSEVEFEALVVSPFVLCRPLATESAADR
jgi:hypothetical protein